MAQPQMPIEPNGRDRRPVPDPTFLTTQQLIREIATLREIIETRLDGMDKATILVQQSVDRVASIVDLKVKNLQEVHDERFKSIDTQFLERDARTEQTARDTKVAVDAALQAAEKAVGKQNESFTLATSKSEAAITKQMDQQGVLIQSDKSATNDKIDDIKGRLTMIEGRGMGVAASWAIGAGLVGMIVGVAGLVVSFVRTGGN